MSILLISFCNDEHSSRLNETGLSDTFDMLSHCHIVSAFHCIALLTVLDGNRLKITFLFYFVIVKIMRSLRLLCHNWYWSDELKKWRGWLSSCTLDKWQCQHVESMFTRKTIAWIFLNSVTSISAQHTAQSLCFRCVNLL